MINARFQRILRPVLGPNHGFLTDNLFFPYVLVMVSSLIPILVQKKYFWFPKSFSVF